MATGWAWIAVSLLVLPAHLLLLHRASGLRIEKVMSNVGCIAASGVLMALVIAAIRHTAGAGTWGTVGGIALGLAAYLASLELLTLRGYVSGLLRTIQRALPALQRTR